MTYTANVAAQGLKVPQTGTDPLIGMERPLRLRFHKAWYEDNVALLPETDTLYPRKEGDELRVRLPTARIITNKHLGLEISQPPQFKLGNERAQDYLNRILKLNGLRGAMRSAAITKSWAGDVGLLFAFKPSERDIFGTPWQVAFIQPDTYDVYTRFASGVFKEVDIYTFEDRYDATLKKLRRWWKMTRYSHALIREWPEVEGMVGSGARPHRSEFEQRALERPQDLRTQDNTLGVIPFVVIQNRSGDTQSWEGVSDYDNLTGLFDRINVALNTQEQGEQIRNKLMLALIDAEEVDVKTAAAITVLDVKSNEDGTTDRQAQIMPAPLSQMGSNGQIDTLTRLLDVTLEAAGVAQTGSARELFGNEAASSSALRTFYSMQTAVALHKRDNWLGERVDYGMSGFVRKLLKAAKRLDPAAAGLSADTDLDHPDFDLTLDWPEMFALSAPERQTEASVAQQANDDGLPPEIVAPRWAKVLDANSPRELKAITKSLKERQEQVNAGLIAPPKPKGGILGSGQGDGLLPDGGSATGTKQPE